MADRVLPSTDPELARAYAMLLGQPNGDLAGFAAGLGLDEPQARSMLDRLAALALVEERERELVALSPLLAMQRLIAREHHLMEQRQEFLRDSYQALTEVLPRYVDHRPDRTGPSLIEQITDLASVRHRLEEMAIGAQQEVLSLTPVARNPGSARAATRELDRGVLERGVVMRTIYPETIVEDEGAYAYAVELTEAGGQVRLCPALPTRMVIVDRLFAAVPNEPSDGTRGCAIVSHPGTVAALVTLFDLYWESGRAMSAVIAQDDCSILERTVLRLLLQGAKDETVARQVRVSVRTVRRCIADLMTRMEVSSRFELGAGAVQRGWL